MSQGKYYTISIAEKFADGEGDNLYRVVDEDFFDGDIEKLGMFIQGMADTLRIGDLKK